MVQLEIACLPIWIFRNSLPVTVIHTKKIDTTSGKSSLWVNHCKICDFACLLSLKPSTLNLFNRVVPFDDASGYYTLLAKRKFTL